MTLIVHSNQAICSWKIALLNIHEYIRGCDGLVVRGHARVSFLCNIVGSRLAMKSDAQNSETSFESWII